MTNRAMLILSAAPCDPELQAEFGAAIPSCLVPVGTKTILDLQIEEAKAAGIDLIFVALPPVRGALKMKRDVHAVIVEDSKSMDETFERLTTRVMELIKNSPFPLKEDEWQLHVINGDTVIKREGLEMWFACTHETSDAKMLVTEETMFRWTRSAAGPVYSGYCVINVNVDKKPPVLSEALDNAKAFNLPPKHWYDFGHLFTYYRSKRDYLSTRAFNSMSTVDGGKYLRKSSTDSKKLTNEYNWFLTARTFGHVARFLPAVTTQCNEKSLGPDEGYFIEYLPQPTLAELAVYGGHSTDFWEVVLKEYREFLYAAEKFVSPTSVEDPMLLNKARQRGNQLKGELRTMLCELVDFVDASVKTGRQLDCLVHGDPCFSNTLFDSRSGTIKLIDPRATDSNGHLMLHGHPLYDYAKIYHSCYGMYDFHLSGSMESYSAKLESMRPLSLMLETMVVNRLGLNRKTLLAATGILFFTMLPLHAEDRPRVERLAHRAVQLYHEFKGIQ